MSLRDEIQAAGPDIIWAIEEAGLDVIVRRPGHPDTVARAVLYQLDDKDATGKVGNPEVKLMAWAGIFKPDAPVRSLPFSVLDSQGRVFVPDSAVQDPVEMGVALIAHLLPLAERTRVSLLTFTLPGEGWQKDARGNDIPTPGTPHPVSARLTATTDPRIRDEVGADTADVVLIGRWGTLEHPLPRPAGVTWGSTSPLDLDGQPGTLTVTLAYPDPDLAQEAQFGSRFLATWRST
ncbi:hypothetical protein [uncultured Deinococcus sp.]|uniref:hypothetical protein n=1 Tax=uncultured Deinococcus sp. TaxID=158789 RepID=UPI003747ED7F